MKEIYIKVIIFLIRWDWVNGQWQCDDGRLPTFEERLNCESCGVGSEGSFTCTWCENSGCTGCFLQSSLIEVACNDGPSKDNCNYKAGVMCGETCQHSLDDCSCDGEAFNIRTSQEFCCNGKKQKFNEPCQGLNGPACYNSYQQSQYLGYNAHFSCPEGCVPLLDMCQGMSWCEEDVKVCNESLKVPSSIQFDPENRFYGKLIEKKSLTTSKASGHHYYVQNAEGKINNGQYDIIDRSDENLIETKVEIADFSKLQFCQDSEGNPGVQCDGNDNICIPRNEWCNDFPKDCGSITTGNDIICSNNSFWKGASCNLGYPPGVQSDGRVCPGRPGQCYYPWYMRLDANQKIPLVGSEVKVLSRACIEKSDQVFPLNQSCPNRTQYHQMYVERFCPFMNGWYSSFCTSIPANFPNMTTDWIDDPHNCWGSCSEPGENCLACSNTDYFQCPRSQVCNVL